ncbi:MAG TPA: ABC transporter substrate-binding protein [Micromonosporaceae bacterium]|nr:ABC transporter substrate-binding protein [Micromonosporaceae bacterium]
MASGGFSRRDLLRLGGTLGVAVPALAACGGVSTSGSGSGGEGALTFASTQFKPVEEADRFRAILKDAYQGSVGYVPSESAQLTAQLKAQVPAKKVKIHLVGGLHGDLATFGPDLLEDLSALATEISGTAGWEDSLTQLSQLGTGTAYYIPWMQATYVVAVHKDALNWLPSGADVNDLTYDQFLDWAIAARKANRGKPVFGLPAGPEGLLHRFTQGHLYPSYTGGMVTTFTSAEAVAAWEYFRELWANCVPSSTRYDFMQEPLAAGEVKVGWDHVARLLEAPKESPDDWQMVPSPRGPKGRGYLSIVAGLAIPKGAPDQKRTKDLIRALCKPDTQLRVLAENGFFPVVDADISGELPPAVKLEAEAVTRTQESDGAILALPPIGLGEKDGQMSKVYKDAFTAIVLKKQDIGKTLDAQAKVMQGLIDETQAACWAPDPPSTGPCKVG